MIIGKTTSATLVAVLLCWSCSSSSPEQEQRKEEQAALVERSAKKPWIDFGEVKDSAERRRLVQRAIRLSRSTLAPYYDGILARSRKAQPPASHATPPEHSKPPTKSWDNSLEFRNTPLREVCSVISEMSGLNILMSLELAEPVTASLENVDPKEALATILRRFGYRLHQIGSIYTVVRIGEEPMVTRTFPLKTGLKIDVVKQLTPIAGPRSRISLLPENRAVIVTATQDALGEVEEYLQALDRRSRQVVIEALLVEVSRNNSLRHGAAFSANNIEMFSSVGSVNSSFLPVPAGPGGNPFTLGILNAKNAIEFMLAADEGIDRLNILHNAFVSTLSGRKATLRVIEKIPYIQATTSIGASEGSSSGTVTSSETIQFEETGVTLDVTPNIGDDDIVEIYVKPTVDELAGFAVGVPVIDTRTAETNLMVKDGETVVLGGLLRNTYRITEKGVPILSDIPLLGELFKSVDRSEEKTELMIFLTPHIIGYGFASYPGANAQDVYLKNEAGFRNIKRALERTNPESMRLDDR